MSTQMGSLVTQEVIDNINEMREDKVWMEESLSKLKRKYSNEYIAIFKKKLIGHDPDFKVLINNLKKKFESIDLITIEFISGEDYVMLQ